MSKVNFRNVSKTVYSPLEAKVTFCVHGVLSPLLSNILLTELDEELERRGHRFCRYADDCNIYVRSQKAGLSLMESLEKFLAKQLKLKVNRAKSAVARPSKRQFLGYTISGVRNRAFESH